MPQDDRPTARHRRVAHATARPPRSGVLVWRVALPLAVAVALALALSACGPTNQPPAAAFSATPTSGRSPLTVALDGSASADPDGAVASYAWSSSDGQTASGVNATLTFTNSSGSNVTRTVTLTVTDDAGASATSAPQTITVSPPNQPPQPVASVTPTSGTSPLTVTLDGSGSSDPDGSIAGYAWSADDGQTAGGVNATLTFTNTSGSDVTRTVTLTVTDDAGASATSAPVSVTVGSGTANAAPIAAFTADRTSGATPLTVSLDASGSSDPDGSIASYSWSADTGATATGVTASLTFATPGDHTVTLSVQDDLGATDTLTLPVRTFDAGGPGYQIDLLFADPGAFSAAEQQAFTDAAARWSQAIAGDLSDIAAFGPLPANACGANMPALAQTPVDDVLIQVQLTSIDGVGNVLARAGPCYFRTGTTLTIYGVMTFDSADAANLASQNLLYPTVLHEMGHVLGLGTFWQGAGVMSFAPSNGCTTGTFSTPPHYTGAAGNNAYHLLGRAGDAPVENDGGQGTRCGHWDEGEFDGELMTGWIEGGGKAMPLSAVTVGSLQDLGYTVDASAADAFTIPSCAPNCLTSAALDIALGEELITPRPWTP